MILSCTTVKCYCNHLNSCYVTDIGPVLTRLHCLPTESKIGLKHFYLVLNLSIL